MLKKWTFITVIRNKLTTRVSHQFIYLIYYFILYDLTNDFLLDKQTYFHEDNNLVLK